MAGYLLPKVHRLSLILFLVTTSMHVSCSRILDGSVLRSGVALPGEDPGVRLENLEPENSGDDSSRLMKKDAYRKRLEGFDAVDMQKVLLNKNGKLVLNFLPKGNKSPPSGPGGSHNDFND